MTQNIRSLDTYTTSLDTYVMGPLQITAHSRTSFPAIEQLLADNELVPLPLSTYESALYTCMNRGAKFSRLVEGGVKVYVTSDLMTRAPVLEAQDVGQALEIAAYIQENSDALKKIAESTTQHGRVLDLKTHSLFLLWCTVRFKLVGWRALQQNL